MITFKIGELKHIKRINEISSVEFPPDAIFMIGEEEDRLVGYCAFVLKNGNAEVLDCALVDGGDGYTLKIICKAAFNVIDLYGIKNVLSGAGIPEELLFELGFIKADGKYTLSLDGYFKPCCEK